MENSKKKMLREVSNDHLTPKKRDDLVQSEIFGDFDDMLNELKILSDKYDTLIKIIKA